MEEIDNLLQKVRNQTNSFKQEGYSTTSSMPVTNIANITESQKPSFSEITPYSENSVYTTLSTGEKIPIYENFIPGTDNQERLAQQQTTGEKWGNGVLKFGAKTLNAVVGGTIGVLAGAGSAIKDGSWSSIYDNNFSNWLADLDTKLNYQLPNYYTKQEQQSGVLGQMGTANFWADKFLGGVSFTAGAIISEGIWGWATGGTSLATTGARIGGKLAGLGRAGRWSTEALGEIHTVTALAKTKSLFKGLDDVVGLATEAAQARKFAIAGGRIGEIASIAGRTARSAGYEASVEALQYKKEAEEKFYTNFADLNGREPNSDEIAQFKKENESTANLVFGANMAIVGASNLIGLGHVLNIKNPVNLGVSDFINKKAFGYGIDSVTNQVIKGSGKQKIARNIFDYLVKPSATEGLFEEGLQGVTNKTANKWIEHTYNPKYTNENFNQVEAFTSSLADQYGSEAGWKDNILGMLIGVAGGSVNVRGEQKAKQDELEFKANINKTFDQKTLQSVLLPNRIQMANRTAGFSEQSLSEEAKGNLVKSHVAKVGAITNIVNGKLVVGETIKDIVKEMKSHLDALTPAQWAENGVEQDQIEETKTEQLSQFKEIAQAWKANKEYVQYMVGNKMVGEKDLEGTKLESIFGNFSKNAQVVESLAYQLTAGEQAIKAMGEMQETFGREIGYENARVFGQIRKLKTETVEKKTERENWVKINAENKIARDKILTKIDRLNKAPRETQALDSHKKEILDASTQLLESEQKIQESTEALSKIVEELNATEVYKSEITPNDTLSVDDLINLEDNIKKFNSIIEQQDSINPQKAKYLKDLQQEYLDADNIFKEYIFTQKALASPSKFKITNIDGWIDNMVKRNSSMNQDTKDWFEKSITAYNDFKVKFLKLSTDDAEVPQAEIEKEQGEVSQETLQSIADKKSDNSELTKTELEIYENKKEVVDELIKQNNLKTKPKTELKVLEEEKIRLEQELKNTPDTITVDSISTQTDTQTTIEPNKEYTISEFAKFLSFDNSFNKSLFNKIKVIAETLNVKIVVNNDSVSTFGAGLYDAESNTIKLHLPSFQESYKNQIEGKGRGQGVFNGVSNLTTFENYLSYAVNHELIHSITSKALIEVQTNYRKGKYSGKLSETQVNAVLKLNEIHQYLKSLDESVFGGKEYAFYNMHELLAEMANQGFVDILSGIELPLNLRYSSKTKSVFENIVEFLTSFFTNKTTNNSAESLYGIINDLVSQEVQPQTTSAQIEKSQDLTKIEEKLDRLKEKAISEGKSDKESDSIALAGISEEERQVLRDSYNSEQKNKEIKASEATPKTTQENNLLNELDKLKSNTDTISEQEYNDFIDKGIVRDSRINSIAEKVKNNEKLSDRELLIFNDKTSEINSRLRELKELEFKTVEENPAKKELRDKLEEINSKINNLKPTINPVEAYKKRIDDMLKGIYKNLINSEDLEAKRPTKEDIEQYRNSPTKELARKLKDWKLMSTLTDDGYISIVDLLDNINQHETELEQEDTKDTVTETEAKDIVNETLEPKGTGNADKKEITNISTEPVVAKIRDNGDIEFSHLKARYIVEQIGGEYKVKRGKNYLEKPNIDQIEPNDIIEIDNISFYMNDYYRIVFNYEQLKARQQQLNLYVEESQTYNNFTSVYSIFGDEKVKTPSQFTDIINRKATLEVKPNDILTLHVQDEDGWNKTKKGGTIEEFKIYLKDKKGNIVYNLKSGNSKSDNAVDENFSNIRLRAFQNWQAQGKPDKMDLGISLKVQSMLYGAPELLYSDGKLIDGDISLEATKKIIGKGFIENGELTLDTVQAFDKTEVSTVYVGRLTKNNPNLKIPIVVFRVGSNITAFPITMKKTNTPIEFDVLLQGTPQEMVKKINQAIIDNRIKTQKLTFEDIQVGYGGEAILSETAEKVREAFANKTIFVDASRLADNKYKVDNLVKDASIRIDLENIEKVFSAPKAILDLKSAEIKQSKEIKYENMADMENSLNMMFEQIYSTYSNNYVNIEGEVIEENRFAQTLAEYAPHLGLETDKDNTLKRANIAVLKEALKIVPKSFATIFGAEKIETVKKLLKQYDFIKSQPTVKEEEVQNGLDNICP